MIALLLIAVAFAAPASQTPPRAGADPCPTARHHHAQDGQRGVQRGQPPLARKLGELPPGSLELAVVRHVDYCPTRAIIRSGYGKIQPQR